MNRAHGLLTVITALAILGLLGLGLILGFRETLELVRSLDASLLAILLVVAAAAFIIAGGLRSVADSGSRRLSWETRLECYLSLLQSMGPMDTVSTWPGGGERADAPPDISTDLLLLASPGVVRTLARLRTLDPGHPDTGPAMAALLREMRRDLDRKNLTLSDNELLGMLGPSGHHEGTDQ